MYSLHHCDALGDCPRFVLGEKDRVRSSMGCSADVCAEESIMTPEQIADYEQALQTDTDDELEQRRSLNLDVMWSSTDDGDARDRYDAILREKARRRAACQKSQVSG